MLEFQYRGFRPGQAPVQGLILARGRREARARAAALARENRFQITGLRPRRTFLFRARTPAGKVIRGSQEAFSGDEVQRMLARLGYTVESVSRRWWALRSRPAPADVVMFIRLSADLLREKMDYDDVLEMLAGDASSPSLRRVIREIRRDLKEGRDGRTAFGRQEDTLGRYPAYMLGLASTSGNMAEVYENTAKFMERRMEFRKGLRQALIMPSVTVVALLATVVFYLGYIFPKTAEMFVRFKLKLPPMTAASLRASHFIQDHWGWLAGAALAGLAAVAAAWTMPALRPLRDRLLTRLPLLGPIFQKTGIEIFCRVFSTLYSGSGGNVDVLRTAAEACQNAYLEKQIKTITLPMMLRHGQGLVESLEATGVFTDNAIGRLRGGAESGTLKESALQVANFYERETTYRLRATIDWIQVLIAIFITLVLTAITVVSSETAVVRPEFPGMVGRGR